MDYRRFWRCLVAEHGQPAPGSLFALEMGRAALTLMRAGASARLLIEAQHARGTGKGRRPSAGAIARLGKRAALDEGSATVALDRLRALAAKHRKPRSLAEQLAARRQPEGTS